MTPKEEYISFDKFATHYDETRAVSDDLLTKFGQEIYDATKKLDLSNNLLEIGSGTGRITKSLIDNNFSVTGIDISLNMLKIASNKAKKENWAYSPVLVDARNLPLKNRTYDCSLTVHVLHLIVEWRKVIDETIRCLKEKGIFFNASISREFQDTIPFKKYWSYITINHGSIKGENRIGVSSNEVVKEYLNSKGYTMEEMCLSRPYFVEKDKLINILNGRYFSRQRNITDKIHSEAMDYLKKENYFFENEKNSIETEENYKLWIYYK